MDTGQEEPSDLLLTEDEKLWAFRRATNSMEGSARRWTQRIASGLTDEQLADALRYEIGTMGGNVAPGQLGVSYQSSGLKIWADRCVGTRLEKPILEGQATVSFARRVYGIDDPDDKQMCLL